MGRLFISILKTEGVRFPLYARLGVFEDGRRRVAIVGLDQVKLMAPEVAELRQGMTAGTAVAPADVLIACSHSHNTPFTTPWLHDDDQGFDYLDELKRHLRQALAQALEARRAAHITVGHIAAPGWNYNRRAVYRTELGEEVGTQGPMWVDDFVRLEGPADDQVQVLLARDESGRALGGIVNYACHPTVMYSVPVWSADYIGPLTAALKERYGCPFVFLNGAAGNLWVRDMSRPDAGVQSGPEYALTMGQALAAKAAEALTSGTSSRGETVLSTHQVLRIPQRRPTGEQVALAQWYLEQAKPGVDLVAFTRRISGHSFTMYANSHAFQEWFCREMIGMFEWQRRTAEREPSEDVEIQAIAVGDVAFVGYPCEVFSEYGLQTRAESPFGTTFVAELANGWHGYIPTVEGHKLGGYEARFGYPNRLVPDAGERMLASALRLLTQLAGTRSD